MHTTAHPQTGTTLLGLISGLREDLKTLLHEEVQLAKKEVSEKVSRLRRNTVYLLVGVVAALLGVCFLLVAASLAAAFGLEALGLSALMALVLGFLAVAILTGSIGGILASKGLGSFAKESLVPEKTLETLQEIRAGGLEQVQVPIKRMSPAPEPADERTSDQIRGDLERTRMRIGREMKGLRTRLSVTGLALNVAHRAASDPVRSVKIGLGTGVAGFLLMRAARLIGRRRAA
ncbi:MAG: phage holin family protein [Verrucomicrobiota bacterium]